MNLTWFKKRTKREQIIVVIVSIVVILYALYALIYAPLFASVKEKQQALARAERTLRWMEHMRQRYPQLHVTKALPSIKENLALLSSHLQTSEWKDFPYQLRETSDGHIQLRFQAVPFAMLMPLLQTVCTQGHLSIKEMQVEYVGTPGLVSAYIVLL